MSAANSPGALDGAILMDFYNFRLKSPFEITVFRLREKKAQGDGWQMSRWWRCGALRRREMAKSRNPFRNRENGNPNGGLLPSPFAPTTAFWWSPGAFLPCFTDACGESLLHIVIL